MIAKIAKVKTIYVEIDMLLKMLMEVISVSLATCNMKDVAFTFES